MKYRASISRVVVSVCGISLCMFSGSMSRLFAADSLPARFPDDAYWRMVSEFSESGGTFSSEKLVSNELYFQHVIPALMSAKRGDVYLGVGPEQNFTYIAALEPKLAFIIDIRRGNLQEILMYKTLFEMATDRADFISMLFSRKRPVGVSELSTASELFDAYASVKSDPDLFSKSLGFLSQLPAYRS